MKIKNWMTKDPVTIGPDEPITEAARIMKERGFHRLPVIKGDHLVGLVTDGRIQAARPSPVSTLSRQEARYLATKIKVSDVMLKDPVTVSPEDDALTALVAGYQKKLGAYPVVADGRLKGIVTSTDFFKLMIHILGAGNREDFLIVSTTAEEVENPTFAARLVDILGGHGIAVLSLISFPCQGLGRPMAVLVKVLPGQARNAADLLAGGGFQLSV